jgi:hypothetical protein
VGEWVCRLPQTGDENGDRGSFSKEVWVERLSGLRLEVWTLNRSTKARSSFLIVPNTPIPTVYQRFARFPAKWFLVGR